jgi:hypothetical protein
MTHFDIQTQHLQEALAACGWEDSAELRQQDTSEAFGFITEKLQLPLLTLEMDIFHEGKGEAADDHKLINERLLEVAVPDLTEEGKTIRLEDCLEDYFNARVEVVRRLERRDTLRRATTDTSTGLYAVDEKSPLTKHIEAAEDVDTRSMTPTMSELSDSSAPLSPSVSTPLHRHPSIIRHIKVAEIEAGESSASGDAASVKSSTRKGSLRKEVLIPAWQFFRIIRLSPICFHIAPSITDSKPESIVLIGNTAWYTAQIPVDDAQVAEHFSSTRPVLGICLKRYAMSSQGQPIRLSTAIDIPLQIALPHFIQDDKATEGGPSFGNFNLLLQSVICHRGTSVHSGHYISFIRGTPRTKGEEGIVPRRPSVDSQLPEYSEDRWIKFDDLASERVTYVDIEKAMAEEMPYLLFYQVQPLVPETPVLIEHENRPPSYQDSGVTMALYPASPVRAKTFDLELISTPDDAFSASEEHLKGRSSFSTDNDLPRKSLSIQEFNFSRRGSLATETSTTASTTAPPITGEDSPAQIPRPSRAPSRFGRRGGNDGKSKSRPSSHVDEHRISATFSRLGILSNKSKEPLNKLQDIPPSDILPLSTTVAEGQTKSNIEVPTLNGTVENEKKRTGKAKDNSNHLPNDPQHAYGQIYTPHKAKKSKDQERECVVM